MSVTQEAIIQPISYIVQELQMLFMLYFALGANLSAFLELVKTARFIH